MIAILLMDDCGGLSVSGPADLFYAANHLAKKSGDNLFQVKTFSLDGKTVVLANGFKITPDGGPEILSDAKVIILPSPSHYTPETLEQHLIPFRLIIQQLIECHRCGSTIAASCTGTFLLAETGLLNNKRATTTWLAHKNFTKLFPNVELEINSFLVEDNRLITTAAGSSSLDLALHIIKIFGDTALSHMCSRVMLLEQNRKSQISYITPWHNQSQDVVIAEADQWVKENLYNEKLNVKSMSEHLGFEMRSLQRHFQIKHSMSPSQFIRSIRTDQAKSMLENSSDTVAEIGLKIGFSDENSFRRSFLNQVAMTPTQYRRKFKQN